MAKNDSPLNFSSDLQLVQQKSDFGMLLPKREWDRIRKSVNQLSTGINWWESSFFFILSTAVTLWITVFTLEKSVKNYQWFVTGAIATTLGTVITGLAMTQLARKDGSTKKDIVENMDYIENNFDFESTPKENDEESTAGQDIKTFIGMSLAKTDNSQGLQYQPLEIQSGALFSNLTAVFSSKSPYWRVGFKFMKPVAESTITTLGDNTALFHLSNTNGEISLDIYPDGTAGSHFHKKITSVKPSDEISLTIDRNEKNFISVYVNDSVEYNDRFDSELFKKAALLAWADDHNYQVSIHRVEYSYS